MIRRSARTPRKIPKLILMKHILIILFSCILWACAGNETALDDGSEQTSSRKADCILRSSIRGYTVLDESNLIVDASGRKDYHVTLRRRAHGLRSSWGIAFDSPTGRVCAGFSEVIFDGQFSNDSISIASIRKLNQGEREDLLIRYGKKKPEIETLPAPREVGGAEVEELDPAATDDPSGD